MKLKPGSLAFVFVYASLGAALGFGSAWLVGHAGQFLIVAFEAAL